MSMQDLSGIAVTLNCYHFPHFFFWPILVWLQLHVTSTFWLYYGKMLGELIKHKVEECTEGEKFKKLLLKYIFMVMLFIRDRFFKP